MTGRAACTFPATARPTIRTSSTIPSSSAARAQTGDVATISPAMRRLTLVHGIVAFAFNTAILALTINVGASLLH